MDLTPNLAAILTLISAITAAVVSIIAAVKNNTKLNVSEKKIDAADVKLDSIHQQTNGNLTAANQEILTLRVKNEMLEAINSKLLGDRRARKAKLAKV